MAILELTEHWQVQGADGRRHEAGSRSAPIEIAVDGYLDDATITLGSGQSLVVWDSSSSIGDFDFFWLLADRDLQVELTVDRGNEEGDELLALIIKAQTPLRLIYDDALANYTANFATGTADVIDRIRVRNPGSQAATIRRVVIT